MLQNTLIVFISDNGAPTLGPSQNYGSNFPFRGVKYTPWEGAVHSVGIIWHAQIQSKIFDGLFHVTDWLPTLVTVAGGKVNEKIDGIDQWGNIENDEETHKRNEILISIDEIRGWAAFREGDFKIIVGDVNQDISNHYGKDLKQLKLNPPIYDNVLLESETAHVFKETLELLLDLDLAYIKRGDFNLMRLYQEPNKEICIPTKGKFNILKII